MFHSDEPDPVAEFDQAMAGLRDVCRMAYAIYDQLFRSGFSCRQAFEVARGWFLAVMERVPDE